MKRVGLALALVLLLVSFLLGYSSSVRFHPAFFNVIKEANIGTDKPLTGVAWSDYDRDGLLDLLLLEIDDSAHYAEERNAVKLYKNNGNGTFSEVKDSGIRSRGTPWAAAFADFDNDGCPDLYIAVASTDYSDILYQNNCDGTFRDVSSQAGITEKYTTRGISWGDYDSDGFLDIYLANNGHRGKDGRYVYEPNILYRNNGDGTFSDLAPELGLTGVADCPSIPSVYGSSTIGGPVKWSYQPIWFDYNQDGNIDLFVATDYGISVLYRNNGDGTFADVTAQAGLCRNGSGMGTSVGDYDNDGNLDLYVSHTGANYLLRNNGDGTFSEVGAEAGVADLHSLGWGTVFFDYDNDGDLDLYVANGSVYEVLFSQSVDKEVKSMADKLFRNNGDGTFSEVAKKEGIYGEYLKEAAAVADYDNDGFVDIFVASSHLKRITQKGENRLYKNRGNKQGLFSTKNNWITIELRGTASNRDAIGAVVRVQTGGKTQTRLVEAGSSYISQNSPWQTFGLGGSRSIDQIEVIWPSGRKKLLGPVKPNQKLVIVEE